jgi:hypothetical protein
MPERLTSRAYEITVDDGRDSFFALSIEGDHETEWLVSDTVCALENMR